jgi:hypothetical protein
VSGRWRSSERPGATTTDEKNGIEMVSSQEGNKVRER